MIDDIASVAVAWADPAQVADVVQQGGDGEMKPAFWGDRLDHGSPAQDGLADLGDGEGMERIVIGGIGAADALEGELGGGAQEVGVVRLGLAEDLAVVGGKALGEGVDGRGKGLDIAGASPLLSRALRIAPARFSGTCRRRPDPTFFSRPSDSSLQRAPASPPDTHLTRV